MLKVEIEIPKPSRFVSNETVDRISAAYSRAFREKHPVQEGKLPDVERLIDELEIPMLFEEEDEPDGARILASTSNDPKLGTMITINERYHGLFTERPDVYAAAIGHEIGHIVLSHLALLTPPMDQDSFLLDFQPQPEVRLHKSTWGWYGLSRDEIQKLKARERDAVSTLVLSSSTSEEAYQSLKNISSRLEPDWMFWQAECFARCLLIPLDLLQTALRRDWNLHSWGSIYELGRVFGVSGTMMRNRMEKIGFIEIVEGQPRPGPRAQQANLFG